MSRFQFVADNSATFEVKRLCALVEIERSSYYAWLNAAPARAERARADAELATRIRAVHAEDDTQGAPRITAELNDNAPAGERVNHKRVARVMRLEGIRGYAKKRRVRTTIPEPSGQKYLDLLKRDFTAERPNRRYVGDITYLPLADGTNLYLATVIDCYSRRLAGWAIADHMRTDVLRVAAALDEGDPDMVLGVRRFTGRVPLRSRVGNALTERIFALATRRRITDTQTGLRAYPARMLAWLGAVPGDRFEYELRLLLRGCAEAKSIREVEIATIYLDENASSHFRPVRDSLLIYRQLVGFAVSSVLAFALDTLLFLLGMALTGSVTASAIGARLLSGTANFTLNRQWVFRAGARPAALWGSARRYAALAAGILVANVLVLHALVGLLGHLLLAKVLTEVTLFAASFAIQRSLVYVRGEAPDTATLPAAEATLQPSPPGGR